MGVTLADFINAVEEVQQLITYLGDSQEKALAQTKLDECVMWVEKSFKSKG